MKLLKLRQYCADMMSDAADSSALRRFTRIVNAALEQVAHSHDWSFLRDQAAVVLDASVAGTALSVTQTSEVFTLTGELWHQRYVDEGWELLVEGESGVLFRFDELTSNTVARMTQEWVQATDAATSYTVMRSLYPLPEGTVAVDEVRLASDRSILPSLTPSDFDSRKFDQLGQEGEPIWYTIRGDSIEVWPAPESADTLLLSRRRTPATIADATPDTYTIDWPDRFEALLLRAIDVQIVTQARASTTLEPSLVLRAFETALGRAKDLESNRQPSLTSFGLRRSPSVGQSEAYVAQRSSVTP